MHKAAGADIFVEFLLEQFGGIDAIGAGAGVLDCLWVEAKEVMSGLNCSFFCCEFRTSLLVVPVLTYGRILELSRTGTGMANIYC